MTDKGLCEVKPGYFHVGRVRGPVTDTDAPVQTYICRNYRGELSTRDLIVKGLYYGRTEHHPDGDKWFADTYEPSTGKSRDFPLDGLQLVFAEGS